MEERAATRSLRTESPTNMKTRCSILTTNITLSIPSILTINMMRFAMYDCQVNHMMRRLKLNFYRAEDEMFIMKKKQWRVRRRIFLITIITMMMITMMIKTRMV